MDQVLGVDLETLAAEPPLSQLAAAQRRELHEVVAGACCFDDLPGKWQAALLEADRLRAGGEPAHGGGHCCGH
jgi:hypothetical protein